MNVVILGHFVFPTGSASASRVRHFAKGLSDNGHHVWVIPLVPIAQIENASQEIAWLDINNTQVFPAGGWLGDSPGAARAKHRVGFLRQSRDAAAKARCAIEELHGRVGVDVVLGYSNWHIPIDALQRHIQRLGIPVVREINEWPVANRLIGGCCNPLYWNQRFSFDRSLPRADGIVAISRMLADHLGQTRVPVLRVPPLIDCTTAVCETKQPRPVGDSRFRLTYLGAGWPRDGIEIMLDAIRKLCRSGNDVCLEIVGDDSRASGKYHNAVINDANLREHFRFHGRVSDDEVRRRIANADVLLLNRRSGRSNEAAFPTRLPEYLMTGNPVIASDVGDVRDYLVDGESLVFVEPDSPQALADGIERIMALPDRGSAIGMRGRVRCMDCFDAMAHGKRLAEFLGEIVDARKKNSLAAT